ncbi:MAG: META domain-containing protein [Anaerolineae bacterium]|jgi:heat shock protein HslJ
MSSEENVNQEEPIQEEEPVYETEPEPSKDKGRTPWIVAAAVAALLALCTCCVLVVGAYLVGRESVDQPPAAPLPPIEQPIEEQPPQAVIIHPTEAQVGIPVEFDGLQSLPGSYAIARYEWTFGDGATGQGVVVTHVYNTPGTYKVTLKVTDSKGLFSTSGPVEVTIKEDAPVQPPQNPLAGTRWQVTAIFDAEVGGIGVVLPGTNLTVAFSRDNRVTGSAGCNDYSASYLVDGVSLAITPPTGTNMLCDAPQGIMEQETAFLSALASAGSYNLQGDKLTILNVSGGQVLELVSAP